MIVIITITTHINVAFTFITTALARTGVRIQNTCSRLFFVLATFLSCILLLILLLLTSRCTFWNFRFHTAFGALLSFVIIATHVNVAMNVITAIAGTAV